MYSINENVYMYSLKENVSAYSLNENVHVYSLNENVHMYSLNENVYMYSLNENVCTVSATPIRTDELNYQPLRASMHSYVPSAQLFGSSNTQVSRKQIFYCLTFLIIYILFKYCDNNMFYYSFSLYSLTMNYKTDFAVI